ncbi:phosphatidate cytidylyltransferase [Nitrosomonas mobilis]|uniref:Phosphatidate cytidylyltransferase n=1 Tax=Nitrosomonas mobilis TaxID=51642 RepID=A0A1G5SEC0_9PROT|nr:phosphatidate cytidylyltransferase [Nitrosomonas mobilis]SCZ85472.1 Phosphatidate cytidylyltransferase [Nitrosomonas mobilis]HNO74525.1 phosphatidate cytidylyltransferase [Nitrosomonas mobilis]
MPGTRILTALVLLTTFLVALFYLPPIFWSMLLLGLTVTAAREWCRLGGFSVNQTIFYLIATTLLGGELLFLLGEAVIVDTVSTSFIWLYGASIVFWLLFAPIMLKIGRVFKTSWIFMILGWVILLPTCLALYQLRAIEPLLLLGFMGVIWVADSVAYFAGRAFGKHKLAPQISPRKTWEGVFAALGGVLIYAVIWSFWMNSDDKLILWLLPFLLMLTVLGIIGDLFESLLKRQAGVKDSGKILPGHGGILDRIDALTSTLPLAVLAVILFYSKVI